MPQNILTAVTGEVPVQSAAKHAYLVSDRNNKYPGSHPRSQVLDIDSNETARTAAGVKLSREWRVDTGSV